jgi:rhodanese-related sulfurtransferase
MRPWFLIGLLAVLLPSCARPLQKFFDRPAPPSAESRALAPVEAAHVADMPGAWILDVRAPGSDTHEDIAGAMHIPLAELDVRRADLPQDKERMILVYCNHGDRSAKAVDYLLRRGYRNVYSVRGGLEAWKAAGFPVVTQDRSNDVQIWRHAF